MLMSSINGRKGYAAESRAARAGFPLLFGVDSAQNSKSTGYATNIGLFARFNSRHKARPRRIAVLAPFPPRGITRRSSRLDKVSRGSRINTQTTQGGHTKLYAALHDLVA